MMLSKPAARASESCVRECPVAAMRGMWRVAWSARSACATSAPESPGICKSITMTSGLSRRAFSSPATPSVAVPTVKPAALRKSSHTSSASA